MRIFVPLTGDDKWPINVDCLVSKPWLSQDKIIALLKKRGLTVDNEQFAIDFLKHVNYYRFSGYCLAFESERHRFVNGTTFDQIHQTYQFDCTLRDLITEALKVIELDLRSAIANYFGKHYGAFAHVKPQKFYGTFDHSKWLQKLREEADRSRELFIVHFKKTYSEFPNLPIWVATEIMSFGSLSIMLKNMLRKDQKIIAARYKRQPRDLTSWVHHLVYIRNLCAHHARLWDRVWSIKPDLPAGKKWEEPYLTNNNRLFSTLLILQSMMNDCPTIASFSTQWKQRIEQLLDPPPQVSNALELMGLKSDWKQHPIWL